MAVTSSPSARSSFAIVGVGASAGGLAAFTELLSAIPRDCGMAFVFIQHLDPTHPSMLAEAVGRATPMQVTTAASGTKVEPDHVYVIPSGADIVLSGTALELVPRDPSRRRHLAIDVFFRSLAEQRGAEAIGVLLSGTGADGTEGLRAIHAEGGITFVQDPATARFPEMPRNALGAGVADRGLPIAVLGRELLRLARHPYLTAAGAAPRPVADDAESFEKILAVVRHGTDIDFSEYKRGTIERRTARRMALREQPDFKSYLRLLLRDDGEARALCEDVLIHVTSFFREAPAFEALQKEILPRILAKKANATPLRVWAAGCSTGEEAYSVAISILESPAFQEHPRPIQVFGSDVSERAIEKARAGVYPEAALRDCSEDIRRKYFAEVEEGYRIQKQVRKLCVFVRHDLARDPPFARLDILSCRNVLIYFGQELQNRLMRTFHYCLNDPGFLMLGRSENIGGHGSLFAAADRANKIFARTSTRAAAGLVRESGTWPSPPQAAEPSPADASGPTVDRIGNVDRLLLARYTRPQVASDEKVQVIQFEGRTGLWLETGAAAPFDAGATAKTSRRPARQKRAKAGAPAQPAEHVGEVRISKEYVEALLEQHGRVNHDLGIANEELISGNEELQSMNEELQTAKEELQSANEELITVNDELHSGNRELNVVNSDLVNLLNTVEIPIVFLDVERRIRRFTPQAQTIFNVLATDVGRPIDDIKPKVNVPTLDADIASCIADVAVRESQVQDQSGRWYRMQIRPYQNTEGKADGAILSLVDIDVLKRHLDRAEWSRDFALSVVDAVVVPLVVLDEELRVVSANQAFYRSFGGGHAEARNQSFFALSAGSWDLPALRARLAAVFAKRAPFEGIEIEGDYPVAGRRTMSFSARSVQFRDYQPLILLAVEDVTVRKQIEAERKRLLAEARQGREAAEEANHAKDAFLATLSHELRTPLATMLMNAQLLRHPELPPEKAARARDAIERSARMQSQLIEDLLDVSRIVAGKLKIDLRPVSIADLLPPALQSVALLAEQKKIQVEAAIDPAAGAVLADSLRMQQVIVNLLTNALKFTPEGGTVKARLANRGSDAVMTVIDSGAGISRDFLPLVFDRFTQQESSSVRRFSGLGLGLSIVRHIVELHGGTVRAESEGEGKGAAFTVTIPLAGDPPAVEKAREPPAVEKAREPPAENAVVPPTPAAVS
jgi:two-component system CheB/CheR fusion protein